MPPMVCVGYASDDGMVTQRNIDHYRERAEGGAGMIVTEATCVTKNGRLSATQLGIWSDEHIEGLAQIAETVKSFGAVSLIQIHHAGLVTPRDVSDISLGPSLDPKNSKSQALTKDEIIAIHDDFIKVAIRARQAGFDGVQIHAAHGYLLSQFASSFFNHRDDEYGGDVNGRMKLTCDIIEGIRNACGDSFIITVRMGANSPTLEDGIEIAQHLETTSVDLLDVSHGGSLVTLPRPPKEFNYNWICYSGTKIKEKVSIPVSVVNEIRTPHRANYLIEHNLADFVNLGRPILADPHWVSKAQHHEEMIVACVSCRPRCKWYQDSSLCPALIIRTKQGEV